MYVGSDECIIVLVDKFPFVKIMCLSGIPICKWILKNIRDNFLTFCIRD